MYKGVANRRQDIILDWFMTLIDTSYSILLPGSLGILLAFKPCMSPFLGSVLIPQNVCSQEVQPWPILLIILRIGLLLLETFFVLQGVFTAVTYVIYIFFVGLLFLWEKSTKLFQIKGSKFSLKKYRELEVIERLFNSCVGPKIFPLIAFFAPMIQIISVFICIQLHDTLPSSQLMIVAVVAVNVPMLDLLFFTGAQKIHTESQKWLKEMGRIDGNKMNRRKLRSMAPLRIWFGNNYVDYLTPLVIQQFCSIQTMNLLLLY